MEVHPAERLITLTGVPKSDDETLKEYVQRVGNQYEVNEEILKDGMEYVTEWQYSSKPPGNAERYERFLDAIRSTDGVSTATRSLSEDEENVDVEDEYAATTRMEASVSETDATVVPDTAVGPATPPDESDAVTGFRSGLRGKEPRKVLVRFLLIVGSAPIIGWMMGRAWVPGHQLYEWWAALLSQTLGLERIPALELAAAFGGGLYLSLLGLFLFDIKKRVQGMLLLLGTGLAVVVLGGMEVFVTNIKYTAPLNVLGFGLGLGVGLVVESGQLLAIDRDGSSFQRPTLDTGEIPEFTYAAVLLFALLSGSVLVSIVQAVLADVVRVYDVVASGAFLVMLVGFIRYESETEYMTLGPERAGKSMLLLGLVLSLRSDGPTDPQPNDFLRNGLERASNLKRGSEHWPIPSTPRDDVQIASFEVISGSYFPRRLQLSALDYAGQHLGRVANLFETGDLDADAETVPQEIADWLVQTDTLLVVLDVERLVYPEKFHETDITDEADISWGLEHYGTILEHVDPEDVIVVATKCDILIDHERVPDPTEDPSFDAFQEAVTEHLQSRPDVDQLLSLAGESTIHPVYFLTKRADGEYVPQLDETENLIPVGYDHLIDELRTRQ